MVRQFTARIETKGMKVGIHAPTCTAAQGPRGRSISVTVEAETADEAAAKFDREQELTARGFQAPRVCGCCR